MKAALERQKAEAVSVESRIAKQRLDIINRILSDACPACKAVFLDFEACFAISCNCGAFFCAWCLVRQPDKQTCHHHVINCVYNLAEHRGLHGTMDKFYEARKKRQERALARMIRDIEPNVIDALFRSLQQEFTDVGINPLQVIALAKNPEMLAKEDITRPPPSTSDRLSTIRMRTLRHFSNPVAQAEQVHEKITQYLAPVVKILCFFLTIDGWSFKESFSARSGSGSTLRPTCRPFAKTATLSAWRPACA